MQKIQPRKSSIDVDNAVNVVSSIIFGAVLLAVLLLVIVIIFGLSIFNGTGNQNLTANISTIQGYIISMVVNFFAMMPTVGTILAVVVLIGVIVLLVIYVKNMAGRNNPAGAYTG